MCKRIAIQRKEKEVADQSSIFPHFLDEKKEKCLNWWNAGKKVSELDV
jgi:hypothetical protein